MRQLLETSVSILDEYWTGRFQQTYRSPRTSDGGYAPPAAVYASLDGLRCGGVPLRSYNAYWCPNGNSPYIAWDESFLDTEARKTGSGATVWLLAAHEWAHHIQWLLDVRYSNEGAKELGADCLAGAVSGQIARQGYYSAARLKGSLDTLANIADPYTNQGHGTAEQRRSSFLSGFNGGSSACVTPNRR
jgi:predicted metalloprotease